MASQSSSQMLPHLRISPCAKTAIKGRMFGARGLLADFIAVHIRYQQPKADWLEMVYPGAESSRRRSKSMLMSAFSELDT